MRSGPGRVRPRQPRPGGSLDGDPGRRAAAAVERPARGGRGHHRRDRSNGPGLRQDRATRRRAAGLGLDVVRVSSRARRAAPARAARSVHRPQPRTARGVGDAVGPVSRRFAAYRWLLERLRPRLWLHGHTTRPSGRGLARHAWALDGDQRDAGTGGGVGATAGPPPVDAWPDGQCVLTGSEEAQRWTGTSKSGILPVSDIDARDRGLSRQGRFRARPRHEQRPHARRPAEAARLGCSIVVGDLPSQREMAPGSIAASSSSSRRRGWS